MTHSPFKEVLGWLLLTSLLFLAACSPLTTSKPYSQITPVEKQQQEDPLYWDFMKTKSGLGG